MNIRGNIVLFFYLNGHIIKGFKQITRTPQMELMVMIFFSIM